MNITYPHTIENCIGEKLIFREVQKEADGDVVWVENFVGPGSGPIMHTHLLQDEGLTVIKGRMACQVKGKPVQYAIAGESVVFKRGTPHRFWNDGDEVLNCLGWLKPANTIVFYLSSLYAAQNKTGKAQPEMFDAAYLFKRYASEYDLPEMPLIVKKVIIPVTYYIGLLLGKYKHFKNAPAPVKG